MIGQTILHYQILEKLGEGGMGVVYKAQDTKLKRIVALKFLPDRVNKDEAAKARFLQEAQAAAALNHSNICTIYGIEESDGHLFISMEFIEGRTLGEKLPFAKTDDALTIALQIGEALQESHSKGIVHRDIKADNIMLNAKGQAKVMDFGLAKLKGSLKLTRTSSTVGTIGYMAPEQIQGGEVDHRSDIFSFGALLFEILTGKLPFRGEHEAAMMYSIVNEEPLPLEKFRTDVPSPFRRVIEKSLQKDPAHRYQSFEELLHDMQNMSSSPSEPMEEGKSIVVLPFENTSSDQENEYFSDGLTEELISDLSKIRSLKVISRSSAMRLKGTAKDVRSIAQELGVRYVLGGSVRKSGSNLRITAQLIDGKSDANIWAEKYAGTLEDVFEIQEKVSRAIVDALKVTLSSDEERKMEERPIRNAQAHDLYLRARQELQRGIPESLDKSVVLLNEGLALVGENELIYAALGHTYYSYFRWISKADETILHRAIDYVQKVFALNPTSSHGFALQGMIHGSQGDIGASIRSLRSAAAIDPSNAEALLWLSVYSAYAGRIEDASKAANALVAIDPFTPITRIIQAVAQIYGGDFEGALPSIVRAFEMDHKSPLSLWTLLITLAWCGRVEEAITHADELAHLAPNWVYTHHALFLKHALRGEPGLALSYGTPELALEAKYDLHFALHVAHCYALINEREKALDLLEHSVKMGMTNYPFLSQHDPLLQNLRGEQRFESLMEKVKLASAHLLV